MPRISIYTLGCKLNYAESDTFLSHCYTQGYKQVPFGEEADLVLVNTCSVTAQADKTCRQIIAKAHRTSPHAKIVVTGCYAQLQSQEIQALPGVSYVVGTKEKFSFIENIKEKIENNKKIHVSPIEDTQDFHLAQSCTGHRTRCFLKVQDGCDYNCSFCTIPRARGASRSASIHRLLQAAQQAAAQGMREIVLTGVNIGDYTPDTQNKKQRGLLPLLMALDQVEDIWRYRISSIEPNLLTDELLSFMASHPKWMPHIHMPLQSGSDRILGHMRRRYKRKHYAARVENIRQYLPEACIGADVIVGFPGETTRDFRDTYDFLRDTDLQYLHVFPFAARPHTPAASMIEDKLPQATLYARAAQLRQLSVRKKAHFYRKYIGKPCTILVEGAKQKTYFGLTENYIRIQLPNTTCTPNTLQVYHPQMLHSKGYLC